MLVVVRDAFLSPVRGVRLSELLLQSVFAPAVNLPESFQYPPSFLLPQLKRLAWHRGPITRPGLLCEQSAIPRAETVPGEQ
jgi:hypothetical protein